MTFKSNLYQTEIARGKCFVICFNARHDLTIAELNPQDILPIVEAWYVVWVMTFLKFEIQLKLSDLRCDLYQKIIKEYSFVKYIQM